MARRNRHRPVAEINVVPYIDVMLVLLIIFMVTAPLLMQGVEVELPKAEAQAVDSDDAEPLIASIKANGELYLNVGGDESAAITLETLQRRVGAVLRANPNKPVLVWGDQAVPYGDVVNLMVALQSSGAENVGLVTESPSD
jgi:biopolymer transport protein TolR